MTTDDYLKSGKYLPPFLRDFHDQKDVFNTMHRIIAVDRHDYAKSVNWVTGQCYVIDIFLWFMARRGWTLQRSRAKVDFQDLAADIEARKESERMVLKAMLAERKS